MLFNHLPGGVNGGKFDESVVLFDVNVLDGSKGGKESLESFGRLAFLDIANKDGELEVVIF